MEKNYLDEVGVEHLIKKIDDGITNSKIDTLWNNIVGNPGVSESSLVVQETEPEIVTKGMIWVGSGGNK